MCIGYQATYSQLAFASKKDSDPFKGEIIDTKIFLAQNLCKFSHEVKDKVNVI